MLEDLKYLVQLQEIDLRIKEQEQVPSEGPSGTLSSLAAPFPGTWEEAMRLLTPNS